MSNPKIWYAVIDGKADGPHEETTIREWLTTGKLNYSDLVFRSGLTKWVNIAECKEFERRGTDRLMSETVAKFQVPQQSESEAQGWVALVKHAEIDGKHHYIQSGPFTSAQVQEKLKRGELKYEDHLWQKGFQSWTPISVISEFERRTGEGALPLSAPVITAEAPVASEKALPVEIKPLEAKTKAPVPAMGQSSALQVDFEIKVDAKPQGKPEAGIPKVKAEQTKLPAVTLPTMMDASKMEVTKKESPKAEVTKTDVPSPVIALPEAIKPHTQSIVLGPDIKTESKIVPPMQPAMPSHAMPKAAPAPAAPVAPVTPAAPAKTISMGVPLSPKDKSAPPPPPPGENAKSKVHEKIKAAEKDFEKDDDDVSVTEMDTDPSPIRKHKRNRFAIATVCSVLVCAFVYAGMSAYKDSLKGNFFKKTPRTVANEPPKLDPNRALPDPFAEKPAVPQPPPVNPEVANPNKVAKVLSVVSLKTTTDHPQLAMETDLPGGTPLHIEITARPGAILKYPSFKLVRDMVVQPGSMPSVDLTSDHLQKGDYIVSVKGGGLSVVSPLSVGVHDQAFKKALVEFKKKVAKQQREERVQLKDGLKFVGTSYVSLTKAYRNARNPAMADAKKKWNTLIKAWKKDFEQRAHNVSTVSERTRNKYVYPEQYLLLKSTEMKLLEVYRSYDKSLKAGREIASDDALGADFTQAFKDLKKSVGKLK